MFPLAGDEEFDPACGYATALHRLETTADAFLDNHRPLRRAVRSPALVVSGLISVYPEHQLVANHSEIVGKRVRWRPWPVRTGRSNRH